MKANELRIGNYFKKGTITTIGSSVTCNQESGQLFNGVINQGYHVQDLEPIPLTEQWLLDFGF